jgi:7-cyano-7-deazaguanine synthase in queuosine biosynthesis
MTAAVPSTHPKTRVKVGEKRGAKGKAIACVIGEHITFKEYSLLSYCFADWQPIIFDMLVVAAAVEFCDRIKRRPALHWSRAFELEIAVHEKTRWEAPEVKNALISALSFLTGDTWIINFTARKTNESPRTQSSLNLPSGARVIVPFSDGMDSRAVAALSANLYGSGVVRVRLGTKKNDQPRKGGSRLPFTNIPYKVRPSAARFPEASNRSRGFKFAMISGIAAYLSNVDTIVVPESGQGALGPVLIPVVHAYPDYRNHPLFTDRMERFFAALLGHQVAYTFPRLWFTKGETLKAFVTESDERDTWDSTVSCWQQNRHVPVEGSKRQCGICAACMLRRTSVHAAGLSEPNDRYVWENLSADSFEQGASSDFAKHTDALRQYAIAGTMHMDHLAGMADSQRHAPTVRRNALQLAQALGISNEEAEAKLTDLLRRHRDEWRAFVASLGPNSFIRQWTANLQ